MFEASSGQQKHFCNTSAPLHFWAEPHGRLCNNWCWSSSSSGLLFFSGWFWVFLWPHKHLFSYLGFGVFWCSFSSSSFPVPWQAWNTTSVTCSSSGLIDQSSLFLLLSSDCCRSSEVTLGSLFLPFFFCDWVFASLPSLWLLCLSHFCLVFLLFL